MTVCDQLNAMNRKAVWIAQFHLRTRLRDRDSRFLGVLALQPIKLACELPSRLRDFDRAYRSSMLKIEG